MNPKIINSALINIGAPSLVFGVLFKIMHWPGSTYLLIFGFILTITWFSRGLYQTNSSGSEIPSDENILDDEGFTVEEKIPNKPVGKIFYGIATFLIVTGSVLKIMHWPLASPILVSGICIGVVWFIIDMFKPSRRK